LLQYVCIVFAVNSDSV